MYKRQDFVVLMTYEYGWSGGPPMAVAPVNEVRRVIEYATSVMPPEKIMMGIPPVSYTHLDVYKRQSINMSPMKRQGKRP